MLKVLGKNGSILAYNNEAFSTPGITPSGTKNITENGTYDVTEFASAQVDVKGYIIPPEFEELSYIEATGTQWIDSDVLPTQHNFVHAKIRLNGGTSANYKPFVAAPPHIYPLQFNEVNAFTPCWSSFSNGLSKSYCKITQGEDFEVYGSSCKGRSTAFSPEKMGGSFIANWYDNTDDITPNVTFGIFARKNADGSSSYNILGRIYWLEISNESGMVAKFVPAMRKSDYVIGMYDVVRRRFFTNNGSGAFAGGTLT